MQMPMPWEEGPPPKVFDHQLLDFTEVDTDQSTGMRYYLTPDGDFPSVTTVLGATQDKSWLAEWRARIGDKEADEIVKRSQDRGTRMHDALEQRLLNNPNWLDACEGDEEAVTMAETIANGPLLDIDCVWATEAPLWCRELGIAGRVDGIAIYKGELTIVDFKNARRYKLEEDIHDYFIQATFYARMLKSMTGHWPKKLVIMMAMAEDYLGDKPLVFEQDTANWINPGDEALKEFKKMFTK